MMSPDRDDQSDPESTEGDGKSIGITAEELFASVYQELRRIAGAKMAKERAGHTLQPTALVHEAYLRLMGSEPGSGWANQRQYLNAASEAMRRILIDHARKRSSAKRGGEMEVTELHESRIALVVPDDEIIAVHEALDRLEAEHSEAAELVKLRYFIGLSRIEASEAMGIPARTTDRIWVFAKAWLAREINRDTAL